MNPAPAASTFLLPALGQHLVKRFEQALSGGPAHTPSVRLTTPRELAHGASEGLTLTLLGLRVIEALRNLPPGPGAPALPIEAHYLATAWATQSVVQQWLLAAALRQVHQNPLVALADLAHPFNPGAPLSVAHEVACRLLPRFPDAAEMAAVAAVIGAETLPASFVIVAGPLLLD